MVSLRESIEISLKDMVDFGNYLLSDERKETFETPEHTGEVWDNDIRNFEEKTGKNFHDDETSE